MGGNKGCGRARMLDLVVCGDAAAEEISPRSTCPLSSITTVLHCVYYFYLLQEVGQMRSDLAQISPGGLVCHAEENIKNTERRLPAHDQQYFLFAQIANSNPLPVPAGAPASGVVVESGPVIYDDAAADEEDEEEEETCVSAMDLLGSNGQFRQFV